MLPISFQKKLLSDGNSIKSDLEINAIKWEKLMLKINMKELIKKIENNDYFLLNNINNSLPNNINNLLPNNKDNLLPNKELIKTQSCSKIMMKV